MTSKYRKPINKQQLKILNSLYKFRFVTAGLLAIHYELNVRVINSRLKILLDQEYIGRNYDSSYRIKGKQASYYLLPKGIKVLSKKDYTLAKVINTIYKDRRASEDFVNHQLNVLRVYNELQRLYPETFSIYSRTELKQVTFEPPITPDLYLKREKKSQAKSKANHLFLNYLEVTVPMYKHVALVKKYLEYAEEEAYEEQFSEMPAVLLVTGSKQLKKRLKRRISRELENTYAEIAFYLCTFEDLSNAKDTKLWQEVKIEEY